MTLLAGGDLNIVAGRGKHANEHIISCDKSILDTMASCVALAAGDPELNLSFLLSLIGSVTIVINLGNYKALARPDRQVPLASAQPWKLTLVITAVSKPN